MGVDGFRLDAIPYLIEREGTGNENLQETHAVIKELRRKLDERYSDRMFLAEANMWPEDVREYFGDADECHVAYHFPLMPRMFMAIAMEDRHPIVEILQQTPDIPDPCQWAIFLRNHDELTLEMVTDRERDYMWNMYAADRRARINLGIRRRLAPLMENDRDRVKLMNSLLLSMPGSPIIYYGDEIGMGDNIFLGDRDGVRTPMQWTSDRNGGFSRADPQRLYLAAIQDPVFGYEAINVESQLRAPASLLNWTRRMLTVRKSTQVFGRGRFTLLHPGNRKVLAYLREYGEEVVLCVANVSRSAQPVELDLRRLKGRVPVEMLGRTPFPPIGELPYLLTIPAYGFYWFLCTADAPAPEWHEERPSVETLPVAVLFDGWNSFFRDRVVPWRIGLAEKTRQQLETDLLPGYLTRQRWHVPMGETRAARLAVHAVLPSSDKKQGTPWLLTLADLEPADEPTRCLLPLAIGWEDREGERAKQLAPAAIAKIRQQAVVGLLADACGDPLFNLAVVEAVAEGREVEASQGKLRFVPTAAFAAIAGGDRSALRSMRMLASTRNTPVCLGERLFLKWYRRVRTGVNPELEMGRYLSDVAGFTRCAPIAGSVDYVAPDGTVANLAVLQAFVENQGDFWTVTSEYGARQLEARRGSAEQRIEETGAGFLTLLQTLGQRTAEMHAALARETQDPAFAREAVTAEDLARWVQRARTSAAAALDLLRARRDKLSPEDRAYADALLASGPRASAELGADVTLPRGAIKTRIHGDYHLTQVLLVNNDFVLADFEGDTARDIAERRAKASPLCDIASMLRSFDYVRHAALQQVPHSDVEAQRLRPVAREWEGLGRAEFLKGYRETAIGLRLYEDGAHFEESARLLRLLEIEKAFDELRDELNHRPEWAGVPLAGVLRLLELPGAP
jgi:maltose alpha-D-glucosyltransferase/alpha-amylase